MVKRVHGERGCKAGERIVHGTGACKAGAYMAGVYVQERRPLTWAVCILLKCNLTLVKSSLHEMRFNPRKVRLMSHQSDCSLRDYTDIFDRYCCC